MIIELKLRILLSINLIIMMTGFIIYFKNCTASIGNMCNEYTTKNVLINLDNCDNGLFNTIMHSKSGIYILNNTNTTCTIRDSLTENTCPNINMKYYNKILLVNKYYSSVCFSSRYLNNLTRIGTILIIIGILNIILIIKIIRNKMNLRIFPSNNLTVNYLDENNFIEIT